MRHIGGTPVARAQVWLRLLGYAGHWRLLGFGYWVVEERASGRVVGEGGLADYKRGLDARTDGVPELGFALATSVHGSGYGAELASAVVRWSDDVLRPARTVALVREANAASRRILERLGYAEFDRREINGAASLLLERFTPSAP